MKNRRALKPLHPQATDLAFLRSLGLQQDNCVLDPSQLCTPSLLRRLASMVYDGLLVFTLLLVATFPFVGLTGGVITPATRIVLQIYLLFVCATYFVWFWLHGGQTLPMKTWKIRLLTRTGNPVGIGQGILRFSTALLGIACAGFGLLWALWDRDRQFLHDRISGTCLVQLLRGKL